MERSCFTCVFLSLTPSVRGLSGSCDRGLFPKFDVEKFDEVPPSILALVELGTFCQEHELPFGSRAGTANEARLRTMVDIWRGR